MGTAFHAYRPPRQTAPSRLHVGEYMEVAVGLQLRRERGNHFVLVFGDRSASSPSVGFYRQTYGKKWYVPTLGLHTITFREAFVAAKEFLLADNASKRLAGSFPQFDRTQS